jgi:hypothetical protein
VTKKSSAPPRDGARERFREPRYLPTRERARSSTTSQSRGTHAQPLRRPPLPRAASASSATPAPPSRSDSPSVRSISAAASSTAGHLKPGTRVAVRTRSQVVIDGRTLVLWLPATVVSATDEIYEVIYRGNLPRDNPFSTVYVPIHHVRAIKLTPPPPSQPPSTAADSLSSSVPKNRGTQPAPRPTTAGKSIRGLKVEKLPPLMPVSTLAARSSSSAGGTLAASKSSEMLPPARPTTAGKSLRFSRNSASETQPPRRPTIAGKSLHLVKKPKSEMKRTSRPTMVGKSLGLIRELAPEMKKPAPRPTTARKSISVIRRTLSEKDRQVLDASCSNSDSSFVISHFFAWIHTQQDKTDRALFFASTVISIGDGRNTPFWEGKWLHGTARKELAPHLYDQARNKFKTVHKELHNMNWIKNLKHINFETLIDEFILLFTALNDVSLNEEKDTIVWRWTRLGEYSAASAYEIQFLGASATFKASAVWKANTKPKCRFFAWLALLRKIPG